MAPLYSPRPTDLAAHPLGGGVWQRLILVTIVLVCLPNASFFFFQTKKDGGGVHTLRFYSRVYTHDTINCCFENDDAYYLTQGHHTLHI